MKKNTLSMAITGALLSASILPFTASADINFSGFASIVGDKISSDDPDANENLDFKQGSVVALQASSDLGDGLGITVQISASGADEWDPKFKWAYASYDATDELRILAGRQAAPFYMYSDYLDVSYAYPWISPPTGVYNVPFSTFDGLGAVYNTALGNSDLTLHGVYGRNTDEAFNSRFEVNQLTGLAATHVYDWLTLRAGYFMAEVSLPQNISTLNTIMENWEIAGLSQYNSNYEIKENDASFFELGFQANFDELIFIGEYTNLNIEDAPFAEEESYYVMAGYQLDSVLMHITYGADESTLENYAAGASNADLASVAELTAFATAKGYVDGLIENERQENSYVTLGARYDFHDSAALKFEYTSYTDDKDSNKDAGLLRVALVTVF